MFNRNLNPITGNRFFAPESEQEKAARGYYQDVEGLNTQVTNRFNNYKNPFEYGDMAGKVEDIFGGYEDIINRDTAEATAKQQEGAGSSLASRGITGGSILTDTQSKIASDINKTKTNALSNLGIGKSSAIKDLMEYFNKMKLLTTQGATDVDFGNIGNIFKKYALRGGALSGLDDDTWLDDTFEGIKSVGNLAEGVGSVITAASDRRFKENIESVGNLNGINLYKFNYIGEAKKFIGVLADEVEHIPGAVISFAGYKFVNYSIIGIPFIEEL